MRRKTESGYTILEVLVAAAILIMVAAAAASLSGGLTQLEEMGQKNAIALNYQEQAARLWQMGMAPADIWGAEGILPTNAVVSDVTFTESDLVAGGVGTVRKAVCEVVFQAEGVTDERSNEVTVIRPSLLP